MSEAQAFYSSLGRRLQDCRKARGLTQEQLGALITPSLTRASIANIEAGKQGVLVYTLVQLAKALEIAVGGLLPQQDAKGEEPELRSRVRTELIEKAGVGLEASERLMQKLLPRSVLPRGKGEHSTSKNRR
jgi:transcriptional regulator with XRE-family HTH domain